MEPFKVGDVVVKRGTKPRWRITKIFTWQGKVTDLAAMEPIRKDGKRHLVRGPLSGSLHDFEKINTPEGRPMATTTSWPLGDLIETFPIKLASGVTYHGALHRHHGPGARRSGRRIVVKDAPNGAVLFDSDECYDLGNAQNKLEQWLSGGV